METRRLLFKLRFKMCYVDGSCIINHLEFRLGLGHRKHCIDAVYSLSAVDGRDWGRCQGRFVCDDARSYLVQ